MLIVQRILCFPDPFDEQASAIQTVIFMFPVALLLTIVGLAKFIQSRLYFINNSFDRGVFRKLQLQAIVLHVLAGKNATLFCETLNCTLNNNFLKAKALKPEYFFQQRTT